MSPTRVLTLMCVLGLPAALLARAALAQTQPTPPTFPSTVELVTVDAVVLDKNGRAVPFLTRDDFVLEEDGEVQEIVSFEAFRLDAEPEPGPATLPAVASNESPASRVGRAFAILVDDVGLAPERSEVARNAVVAFLERSVRDGDGVTLGTTSGIWWSGRIPEARQDLLAVLSRVKGLRVEERTLDYMTDYEAFWIRNYEDSPASEAVGPGASSGLVIGGASGAPPPPAPGGMGSARRRVKLRWEERRLCVATACDGLVRARAADLDARRAGRTRLALQAVRRGLDALAPVRGRKSLLLLSDGFLQDFGTGLREVAAASREANTAIYFVDVRGLLAQTGWGRAGDTGPPPDPRDQGAMAFEETTLAAAGTELLADETGGFSVRNTNDLAAGIDRIADESRVFYMLGFYPPEGKAARRWRKLRVEVKRPGLTVRARRGYTLRVAANEPPPARKQDEPAAPHPAVARALDSAQPNAGIPLRAMAYVLEPRPQGKVHVVVAAELDASGLSAEPREGSRVARLELSVVTLNRDSGRGYRHDETLELRLDGGDADGDGWRSLYREFELQPGVTQARVVVRDAIGGAIGSVSQRFEVPDAGALRLSTPILTDRVELPRDGQSRPQPVLAVHRTFASGGGLYCEFEVFGAARPKGGGAPKVSVGLALRRSDGRLVFDWEPTPIVADPDGRVVRLVGMALENAEEGLYDLVFDVRDEVSGTRLERREAFRISRQVASR